jgi:DNA-directed RNA polymerase specialized sigma24 family protein
MTRTLFEQLAREWSDLGVSAPAAAALKTWSQHDPALAGFQDLADVVGFVHRSGVGSRGDAVCACLAARAPSDPFAARTLLHVVFYGLMRITSDLCTAASSEEDAASTVIVEAYQRIRTYPLERRPRSIAANILLDTRQGVSRSLCRRRVPELLTADIGRLAHESAGPSATDELVDLIDEAVRTRKLRVDDARLIVLSRVADVSTADLAAIRACTPQSLRRHRQRAEAAFALAVGCVA